MKRAGNLLAAIAALDNLRLAFWKAAKGKRAKADCRRFERDLEGNLERLAAELLSGCVRVGDYHYFRIQDPKERLICAATFRERVMHHALMNVCEPVLERAAIADSYACRKSKGGLAAVARAQGFAARQAWFLKMDVARYFDSVDHDILGRLLQRRFKDQTVLGIFRQITGSYATAPGRGLPIGNLSSQHFANFYLGPLDRFVKERLGRRAYVRYMDDFVIWGHSARELRDVLEEVGRFLAAELKLRLKPNTALNKTAFGMDFLGYRVFPRRLGLARRSKVRFTRKLRRYERAAQTGGWTELQLQQRVTALLAFVLAADSMGFRRQVLSRFGVTAM
jgi:retron-type reverse transcriptase